MESVEEGLDIGCSIGSVHLEVIGFTSSVQYHMNLREVGQALANIEQGIENISSIVDAGFVTAFLHATAASIYGLIGMGDQALEQAKTATGLVDSRRRWSFQTPVALAYVQQGCLPEAEEALQPVYSQPRFESKRHMDYFGIITSLPDVVRGELALAEKDFQRVLGFNLDSHGAAGDVQASLVLPDLLRIKAQALVAEDRLGDAQASLDQALEIAESRGSLLTIWRILFEMSKVAALENRDEDRDQLLQRSKELINHIADLCGGQEVRDGFLNQPAVRRALNGA
jgi:tetratricopeptide (TPR) repeat protein